MRKSLSAGLAAVLMAGSVVAAPAVGSAQTAPNTEQAAAASDASGDIAAARAQMRAAYATHDPAKIARARQQTQGLWQDQYADTHPRSRGCERDGDAANHIARARAQERAAYASHDQARIAALRHQTQADWQAAYRDTHGCGRTARR